MDIYSQLSELCHQNFEARHLAREEALKHSRLLTPPFSPIHPRHSP